MMTFILVVSGLLIAFIGLLRYDIHKHKHVDKSNHDQPDNVSVQSDEADQHNDTNKT